MHNRFTAEGNKVFSADCRFENVHNSGCNLIVIKGSDLREGIHSHTQSTDDAFVLLFGVALISHAYRTEDI